MSPILPPTPQGGLSKPQVFNKSPLGDLGVDIEKVTSETVPVCRI